MSGDQQVLEDCRTLMPFFRELIGIPHREMRAALSKLCDVSAAARKALTRKQAYYVILRDNEGKQVFYTRWYVPAPLALATVILTDRARSPPIRTGATCSHVSRRPTARATSAKSA